MLFPKKGVYRIYGIDDYAVAMAASAAMAAGTSVYNANQANSQAAGNAYTSNMVNMFSQAQNQMYNADQARQTRDFNSAEAQLSRNAQNDQRIATQQYNSAEAAKNREFQAYMSNTSYRRAMDDMKAAGLNPMLAYQQGGAQGAPGGQAQQSTPSMAQASGGQASSGGGSPASPAQTFMNQGLTAFTNSAADYFKNQALIENMNADTEVKKATVGKTERETLKIEKETDNIRETLNLIKEQTRTEGFRGNREQYESYVSAQREELTEIETKLKKQQIDESEAREQLARIQSKNEAFLSQGLKNQEAVDKSDYGKNGRPYLNDIGKAVNSANGVRDLARPRIK